MKDQPCEVKLQVRETDWSECAALRFWCHATRAGQSFEVRCSDGDTDRRARVELPKKGWQEVRLVLRGAKSDFKSAAEATWASIRWIKLSRDPGTEEQITVDEIRVERSHAQVQGF